MYPPEWPYGALVGFSFKGKQYLCEFDYGSMQPHFKDEGIWYVSMGNGQHITDPFLAFIRNVFWGDSLPSLQEGIFAVTWALQHVIDVNPGGINKPIRVGVLTKALSDQDFSARFLDDSELQEHQNQILSSKNVLKEHVQLLTSGGGRKIPSGP